MIGIMKFKVIMTVRFEMEMEMETEGERGKSDHVLGQSEGVQMSR